MEPPLAWRDGAYSARSSLFERMFEDRVFALDVVDLLLRTCSRDYEITGLQRHLAVGGSVWEIRPVPQASGYQLVTRTLGPVTDQIAEIQSESERAGAHLASAWAALMGRNPEPSTAYREAIKAVEVVAKPVLTPNDTLATLGKMLRALDDAPHKWRTRLDHSSPEQVAAMMRLLWKGQTDRHGTDDEDAPLSVSLDEADAAVHLAVTLVRFFAAGHIAAA